MSSSNNRDADDDKSWKHPTVQWGQVRASPYGACLVQRNAERWHDWRNDFLQPLVFPKEGFGHVYGQGVIDAIDQTPLGSSQLIDQVILDKLGVTSSKILPTVHEQPVDGHDYGSTKTPGTSVFIVV